MKRLSPVAPLLALAVLSGCSSSSNVKEDRENLLPAYESSEAILKDAEDLLTEMKFDDVSKLKATNALKGLLAVKDVKLRVEAKRCSGVGTWTAGGGGLIVKFSKSHGLISLARGVKKRAFDGKAFAVGAILGGGKTYGTFLIFGLSDEKHIRGSYTIAGVGGAFGETGARSATLTPSNAGFGHKIWAAGLGTGFGGEAGVGKISLRWITVPPESAVKKTGGAKADAKKKDDEKK